MTALVFETVDISCPVRCAQVTLLFQVDGFQVDVYRARPEAWGVILLVRTGSREHNVKLCTLAKGKGLMLSAAQGVISKGKAVASRTEEEIFKALGLVYIEPKEREVLFA